MVDCCCNDDGIRFCKDVNCGMVYCYYKIIFKGW